MKTMNWLLKREYWEHKGMMFWAPLVVAGLMTLFALIMFLAGNHMAFNINDHQGASLDLAGDERQMLVSMVSNFYPVMAAPLYVMLAFLVFFYCLGALYDERRDRSILFWKSLPISDSMTVLSKAAVALIGMPLIIAIIAFATSLLMVVLAGLTMAFRGANLFGDLLASPAFWLSPIKMLSLVPVYMLWALPTVGWLLLVSSWARSKVFLWAVGAPLLSGALLAWADRAFHLGLNVHAYFEHVVLRLLGSVLPGAWLIFNESARQAMHSDTPPMAAPTAHMSTFYQQAYASLGSMTLWLGVAAGVAMIAGAIWMRRWREEG
jgi:ABC-2 type transport system permease protein